MSPLAGTKVDLIERKTLARSVLAVADPKEGITLFTDLEAVAVVGTVLIVARDNAECAVGCAFFNLDPRLVGVGLC